MLTKYRYSTIALLSAIANATLILGGGSLTLSAATIARGNLFNFLGYTGISMCLFILGLAATFVAGVYQLLYYIFQDKQKAALIGGLASLASFCMYLFGLSNFIISIIKMTSQSILSFIGDTSSLSTGGLWLAFIISIVALLFNGAVMLQMKGLLHISLLGDLLAPNSFQLETAKIEGEATDIEEGEKENEKTVWK